MAVTDLTIMCMYHICVSIVNTGEKDQITQSLRTLFANMEEADLRVCVVIVDNGSRDTVEELEQQFPDVRIIKQEQNEGFGKSHNKAMRAIEAEYYFILNPDTEFANGGGFLHAMHTYMEQHLTVGIAGPKILYPDGSLQYSCYRFPTFLQPLYSRTNLGRRGKGKEIADMFLMKDFDHNQTIPVDWVMGSAMFVRKSAIDRVGMFDDRFWMYAEDSDWCRRMWQHNWEVHYVHHLFIKHSHGRASAKVPGIITALIKNKYARAHLISWMKYFWKWRGKPYFSRRND